MPLSDPIDKVLHIAGAIALVGGTTLAASLFLSGPELTAFAFGAATFNAIWWPSREIEQRRAKGKRPFHNWSADNHAEAWPPGVAGFIIAALT